MSHRNFHLPVGSGLTILLISLFLLSLPGCLRKQPPPVEDTILRHFSSSLQNGEPKEKNVRFYLDASGSMKGFLSSQPGRYNRYSYIMQDLLATKNAIWSSADNQYYLFGEGPVRVNESTIKEMITTPVRYDQNKTDLTVAFPDSLSTDNYIVVTDNVQDLLDGNPFQIPFIEKKISSWFRNGGLMEMIIFRSQFNGSVSQGGPNIRMKTGNKYSEYRPFYIYLFSRSQKDIKDFCSKISSMSNDSLVTLGFANPISLVDLRLDLHKDWQKSLDLFKHSGTKQIPVEYFEWRTERFDTAELTVCFQMKENRSFMGVDLSSLIDSKPRFESMVFEPRDSSYIRDCVDVGRTWIDSLGLNITFKIKKPSRRKLWHVHQIKLILNPANLEIPGWIKELSNNDADSGCVNKTLFLDRLIGSISSAYIRDVTVAQFYLAIRR